MWENKFWEIFTNCSVPHGGIISLIIPDALKLSLKQTQGNTFIIDLPKTFLAFKPPGMWNVKQKYYGMGQNTLQCCYGHYVTKNQ